MSDQIRMILTHTSGLPQICYSRYMLHKIAVFDFRFLPETQKQIQSLATNPVRFPDERCTSEQEFIARTGDADIVLVCTWDKVTASYLDACPAIRYIGLCGTSTANVNLDELKKRNIAFSNIVLHNKESVAEFVFMQLVRLARGIGEYQWKTTGQHELMGTRIGIIGLGAVGQAIAHLALAYKMRVSYYSPHRKPEWEDQGLQYLDMTELVQSNEILVACGPTNVEVLGQKEFNCTQPGSIVVQTSGGTVFDQQEFLKWIAKEGNYAVFERSASDENYRTYKDLPQVIYSELVAGDTYESSERRGRKIIENLKTYLKSAT